MNNSLKRCVRCLLPETYETIDFASKNHCTQERPETFPEHRKDLRASSRRNLGDHNPKHCFSQESAFFIQKHIKSFISRKRKQIPQKPQKLIRSSGEIWEPPKGWMWKAQTLPKPASSFKTSIFRSKSSKT